MAAIRTPSCTGFNRIRRPGYLHGKLGQEVRGVPYCWGCHGSLQQFRARIERGMMAGNVCTRNAPRTDVAGVDCSAFVSAAWGLATHFTTAAIPAITTPLSEPLGPAARRCAQQAGLACDAVPALHAGSQGRGDGILDRRLQRPGLPQCLSARVAARARLSRRCVIARSESAPAADAREAGSLAQQIKGGQTDSDKDSFVRATRKRRSTRHHKKHSCEKLNLAMNFWFTKTILLLTATASALATAISLAWRAGAGLGQPASPAGRRPGSRAHYRDRRLSIRANAQGRGRRCARHRIDIAPQRRR